MMGIVQCSYQPCNTLYWTVSLNVHGLAGGEKTGHSINLELSFESGQINCALDCPLLNCNAHTYD